MTKKQKTLLEKKAERSGILAVVANDALDNEDPVQYLKEVSEHGCVSGVCTGLIYYSDTHEFYQTYSQECDDVLSEYEDMTGEAFAFKGQDVQNTLAWMAYEERARQLYDELTENN